ncbi:DUF2207 domain-containing protein [Dysgonomonas sp. 25]|uniref:DUF2207 domain-containing protein n=1 Tax=Dysgonomonas sp. 25 TaxID=2302933 RepID=UPI0013D01279|nr:DUF2207 domain-containing protein [Dysgonomonas sp. 25]NDV70434.1 DUF2207 domain-containing protein [Dysgonomonas sp. 25]
MRKIFLCFFLFLYACAVFAQEDEKERITGFHSEIVILENGNIRVTERISVYSDQYDIRHGIVRTLPYYFTNNAGKQQVMRLKSLSVKRNGQRENTSQTSVISGERSYREIYIGDSERLLPRGEHEYTISYETPNQLFFHDDSDELYWNVTGNDWAFDIDSASVRIILPDTTSILKTNCYTGAYGSTTQGCESYVGKDTVVFTTKAPLMRGEGLTVSLFFPRDIVKRPPPPTFWEINRQPIFAGLSILVLLFYCFLTWSGIGRDPQKQIPVPTFNPPNDWSPAVSRFLYKKGIKDSKLLSATIISLAVKGAIGIASERKVYTLIRNEKNDKLTAEESNVYDVLFPGDRIMLKVSDKHYNVFQKATKALNNMLKSQWNIKKIFQPNTGFAFLGALFTLIAVFLYFVISMDEPLADLGSDILFYITGGLFLAGAAMTIFAVSFWKKSSYFLIIIGLVVASIGVLLSDTAVFLNLTSLLYVVVMLVGCRLYAYLIKSPTEEGVKILAELEGFRMYMETAEEHRLDILTPPERTPELFERLLSYAIALDVENKWSKKFDEVLSQAGYEPDWYRSDRPFLSGRGIGSFSRSFVSSISSSSVSPNSGSGGRSSSGGGFSGGGRGGGGGRGW